MGFVAREGLYVFSLFTYQQTVAGTRIKNGGLQNTSSVGTEGLQEKARMAKERLDGHCQTRSEGHGHYLE